MDRTPQDSIGSSPNGVETGGSGGSMNWDPKLLGAPSGVTNILGKKIIGLLPKY